MKRVFDTTPDTSARMAKVKSRRGDMEVALAKELWHRGLRYRYNYKKLPGCPDIAILKYKIAVFIDGEFWHGYDWDKRKPGLKRNRDYWIAKIERNMDRDRQSDTELKALGWTPIHFGERKMKKRIDECADEIIGFIQEQNNYL